MSSAILVLITAHRAVGGGGGGAIGFVLRCGGGAMAAARLSAANLAGDGTPVLNFLQMQLFLTEALESVCLRSPCLGTYFMSCFTNLYLIKSSSFLLFWKVAAS